MIGDCCCLFVLGMFFFFCEFIFIRRVYVDVIGLLSGISFEREYVRDGKMTKIIVIELTDYMYVDCWFSFTFSRINYYFLLDMLFIHRNVTWLWKG